MRALLSLECDFYGVHIAPCTIAHPRAGMCPFATQLIAEVKIMKIIWVYDCRLIYRLILYAMSTQVVF